MRYPTTAYFDDMRQRNDRKWIKSEWIERAIERPVRRQVQANGRLRCWVLIEEADGRWLRVVLLADGRTVHNAFFDRGFQP